MAKESAAQPVHIKSDKATMVEIAWEMTKHAISARPDADITPQSLRDEFAQNLDAVYQAWRKLGNTKGGR